MGTIIKIKNADYSQKAIAKYDFADSVLRKFRTDLTLEKNALFFSPGRSIGLTTHPVSVFSGEEDTVFKHRFKFTTRANETQCIFDFVSDNYEVALYVSTSNVLSVMLYDYTKGKSIKNNIGTLTGDADINAVTGFATGTEHSVEVTFTKTASGNTGYTITGILFNGVAVAISLVNASTSVASIGNLLTINGANLPAIGGAVSQLGTGRFWLISVKKGSNILFHLDFLGDTENEILTEKVNSLQLIKGGSWSAGNIVYAPTI